MIEEHDLRRSEDTGGNDKLSEHILGYRRPAGPDNVDIGMGSPRIPGRSESLGSMQVTTAILGVGRAPSFRSCFLAYVWFAFSALSIILIRNLHIGVV